MANKKKTKRKPSSILQKKIEIDPLIEKRGELVRITLLHDKKCKQMKNLRSETASLRTWMERLEKEIESEERSRNNGGESSE